MTGCLWSQPDAAGNTALIYAITGDFIDCVSFLINQGADPNIANHDGDSPLHL